MSSQPPTPPTTDDLFASLGGSLMQDLWKDLQVGEDTSQDDAMLGWSLEQLERELAHLDDGPSTVQAPPGMPSAASLVVSHAQEQQQRTTTSLPPPPTTTDAWSASLQNFTALSLEQDFLAADSARKQTSTTSAGQEDLMANAQDYNVAEQVTVQPPPGLAAAPRKPPGMPTPEKRETPAQETPVQRAIPPTPPNSRQVSMAEDIITPSTTPRLPPTPQNSQASLRVPPTPQNSEISLKEEPQQVVVASPVVATPVVAKSAGPAWQTTTTQQTMPTRPLYCQSHPSAPPVPATALESALMKARDLAYVLHSMLKPILIAGVSPDDYDAIFFQRQSGMLSPSGIKANDKMGEEMQSRTQRTKEWMAEKSTLGHVAKTDVTRPRALIAVHTAEESQSGNKERASLWKARLYIDHGYQAYHGVVEVWRAAPPGSVPPEIQAPLAKLLKCLGVSLQKLPSEYAVDRTVLALVLKLPKGQVLLARILEQALLPPKAVQALLPVALDVAIHTSIEQSRLYRSLVSVFTNLPNIEGECLLASIKAVSHPEALASTVRMECIHALLQRGNALAAENASFAPEWKRAEQQFMELLG